PLAEFLLHWLPGGPGLPGSPRPFSSSSFLFVSCSTCGTTCRRCLFRLVSCSTRRTACRRSLCRFVSCSARCAACCRVSSGFPAAPHAVPHADAGASSIFCSIQTDSTVTYSVPPFLSSNDFPCAVLLYRRELPEKSTH